LGKITSAPVSTLIIVIAGGATYFSGLWNPFQGDDFLLIVNNPVVHSISNIATFFQGGTFYYGQSPLGGGYYRPIVTTVFSLLYTAFGPNPFYYHLLQMLLCIASTILLYQFFRYSLKPGLALILSLIFLVHPANSQVGFAIPYMQDALFFFFGILALWLLLRFRSTMTIFFVVPCLMLSLLSKETGVFFVAMALIYLIWWDRQRLYAFLAIMAAPIAVYLLLKVNATGLNTNPDNAPIDSLGLGGRLLTAPSIVFFYITKLVWPVQLASAYYWVHQTLSFEFFVLPLLVDLAVIALIIYSARQVRRKGTVAQHRTFWFFAAWSAIGLLAHLQIIPLDMTVSEPWFYFPMAGILGMIGVGASALAPSVHLPRVHLDRRALIATGSILVVALGARTALRGTDYNSAYSLAQHDIAVSPEDYNAEITIAYHEAQQGNLGQAKEHAYHAVGVYGTSATYNTLGVILLDSGDYPQAKQAFLTALSYQESSLVYNNMAGLTALYGDPVENRALLTKGLQLFPQDGTLWLYLAILDQRNHNNAEARAAISQANAYGAGNQYAYTQIMNNAPITVPSHPNLVGS
jgi:Flp pilus assembly protein TadD